MKAAVVLSVLIVALGGCRHYRTLGSQGTDSYAEVNQRAAHTPTVITLREGAPMRVQALRMAADSTSWLYPDKTGSMTVATRSIMRVELRSGGKGAIEGLGIGLVAGTIIGALLARGGDTKYFGPSLVLGSFLGLPIGVALKSRVEYRLLYPVERRSSVVERSQ